MTRARLPGDCAEPTPRNRSPVGEGGSGHGSRPARSDPDRGGGTGSFGSAEQDPEILAERRRFAEMIELPTACTLRSCRGGHCRGPRGASEAFPDAAMPDCLARMFDEMHAPVRRWRDFWDGIAANLERLTAKQEALETASRSSVRARD